MTSTWLISIRDSFERVIQQLIEYLPAIVGALIILIIGLLIASALGQVVRRILTAIHIDEFAERLGMRRFFDRIDERFSLAKIGGGIVQWTVILMTIVAVSESLGLVQVTAFLQQIIAFIPNIIVAAAILIIGFGVSRFVQEVVTRSMESVSIPSASIIGTIARSTVMVFTILVVMVELGIAPMLMSVLLSGFIFMIALAGGLAFGLGGRDAAHDMLDRMRQRIGR